MVGRPPFAICLIKMMKKFFCSPLVWMSTVFLLAIGYDLWCEKTLTGDFYNFPLDDSWIHLTFGRNFAFGLGFGVNPHEPAAASTSVLWSLWVALVHLLFQKMGLKAVLAGVKTSGVMFSVLAFVGILRIFSSVTKEPFILIMSGLLALTLYPFSWAALSGMEIPLTICVCVWALVFQLIGAEAPENGSSRRIAAVLWGMAVLCRPENLVPALPAMFILGGKEKGGRAAGTAKLLGYALILVIPYVMVHYRLSGQPFPHTFTSKMTERALPRLLMEKPLGEALAMATTLPFSDLYLTFFFIIGESPVASLALLFFPVIIWWKRTQLKSDVLGTQLSTLFIAWSFIPLQAFFVGLLMGPVWYTFQHGRYPAQSIVLGGVAALTIAIRLWQEIGKPRWIVIFLVLAGILAVDRQIELGTEYALEGKNIRDMQVTLGRWLGESLPQDLTIAVSDIGAMSYFGRQKLIDLEGLLDPAPNAFRRQGKMDVFLRKLKPDLLILFPMSYPELQKFPEEFKLVLQRVISENVTGGHNIKAVYQMPWTLFKPTSWPPLPTTIIPEAVPLR